MATADLDGIAIGVLLDQIDIGHQRRAGITAFKQIVTENQVIRKTAINGLTERIYIIDTLADK